MSAVAVTEREADRRWEPISDFWAADEVFGELDRQAREWAGVMAASTAAFVEVLAEVDARGLCEQFGFRSLEQWVSLRCGISFGHAKRLVSIARGLAALPLVREQFAAGAVSEDQMVEIAKAGVTAFHDRDAADFAASMTVPQLRKALSFLPDVPATDAAADAEQPDPAPDDEPPAPDPPNDPADPPAAKEWINFGVAGHGEWELHLRLSAERGAIVEKAIEAGRDREHRDRHGKHADLNDPPTDVSNLDGFIRLVGDCLLYTSPSPRDS